MNKSIFYTLYFILCLITSNSFSEPVSELEPETVYQIEVLIFEQVNPASLLVDGSGEIWRELEENTFLGMDGDSLPVELGEEGLIEEGIIKELPSSSQNLLDTRKKLDGSERYQVLYHKSWSQAVVTNEENTAVWIEVPGVLAGTINLLKRKYLHINTDLVFNSMEGSVRLKENRRLRPKELHYFDHPLFGVLIRIVEVEEEVTLE